jgi:hypothetical protein
MVDSLVSFALRFPEELDSMSRPAWGTPETVIL